MRILKIWQHSVRKKDSIALKEYRLDSRQHQHMNIKQILSSPFQHQSNGLAERQIRTMRDMVHAEGKSNSKIMC